MHPLDIDNILVSQFVPRKQGDPHRVAPRLRAHGENA